MSKDKLSSEVRNTGEIRKEVNVNNTKEEVKPVNRGSKNK